MNWYIYAMKNYALFDGRARRKEFWSYAIIQTILFFGVYLLDNALETTYLLTILFMLIVLMPTLAVATRRLHDLGRSGGLVGLLFIPVVNMAMLVFFLFDSESNANQYGPNPKEERRAS